MAPELRDFSRATILVFSTRRGGIAAVDAAKCRENKYILKQDAGYVEYGKYMRFKLMYKSEVSVGRKDVLKLW